MQAKNKTVAFKVSETELEYLKNKAEELELSVGQYSRKMALDEADEDKTEKESEILQQEEKKEESNSLELTVLKEEFIENLKQQVEAKDKQLSEKDLQLNAKDQQIGSKDKQIEDLHRLMDQQQQLTLATQRQLEVAKIEVEEEQTKHPSEKETEEEAPSEKRAGLFGWFKKK